MEDPLCLAAEGILFFLEQQDYCLPNFSISLSKVCLNFS